MAQLSTELLLLILKDASGATLKSIRLTCRRFCLLSSSFLFRRIRFALHKDFIQPLVQVARHKELRLFVRELVYVTLYNYHPISGCALKSGYDSPYYLGSGKNGRITVDEFMYKDPFSEKTLPALRRLPNVTSITLSNEISDAVYNNRIPRLRNAIRFCSDSGSWMDNDFGLWGFLHTLSRSGLQIRDISTMSGQDIQGISLSILYIDKFSLENFQSLARNFRSINLWIWAKEIPYTAYLYYIITLRSVLTSAKQLEILSLRLPQREEYVEHFQRINLLETLSWNRLQHLMLRNVRSQDLSTVYNFIKRHETLQVVRLHVSRMTTECLKAFLEMIADLKNQPTGRFIKLKSKAYIINKDESDINPDVNDVHWIEFRYNEKDDLGRYFTLRVFFDPKGSLVSVYQL